MHNPDTTTSREQKTRVREFFEASESWQGALYDDQSVRFNRAILRRKEYAMEMIAAIPPDHRGKALDVGCGCGVYTAELMRLGYDTYASDLAQRMLDSCRDRMKLNETFFRRHFRRGDIEAIPFGDDSFDLVISIGVLGYLLSDEKALDEVRRVLRPGGYFLVSVQNMGSLSNIDYVIRQRLRGVFTRKCRTDIESANLNGGPVGQSSYDESVAMAHPWVNANSSTHHFYKSYFPRRFERMMERQGFWLIDAMTFGHEFRLLRRFRLLPESLLMRLEIFFERLFWHGRVPFLRYSGEAYTALFQLDDSTGQR